MMRMVTSTALMILVLKEMGKVEYLVPDRFKYGYGLTLKLLSLQSKAINLMY